MSEWKDVTSYSRSEVDRAPRTWRMEAGCFRLTVTRRYGLQGWFGHVDGIYDYTELSDDLEHAKKMLVDSLKGTLQVAIDALEPRP